MDGALLAEAVRKLEAATERSTRQGQQPRTTLEVFHKQNADDRAGTLGFDTFKKAVAIMVPGTPPASLCCLFET